MAADKKVVVCKYVGTPPGTPDHVIIVNASSLEGKGFTGSFPFDFSDAQESKAIRFAADKEKASDVSLTECGATDVVDVCPDVPGDQPEGTDCDEVVTDDGKKVVVCKFTGTPPGTFDHIIIVDESALGQDWDGLFPADFNDAHGSYAIRYAEDGEQASDVATSECVTPPPFDQCPDIEGDQPEGTDCTVITDDGKKVVVCSSPDRPRTTSTTSSSWTRVHWARTGTECSQPTSLIPWARTRFATRKTVSRRRTCR